ncbi:MAG: glycosyltransferase [Chitinivibrionales bacterium]|nr:glycosyltransferase [Chitinivibrionales bacterium]
MQNSGTYTTPIRVLQLNDARGWRGGEAQTLMLSKGLNHRGCHSIIAAAPHSELAKRNSLLKLPFLPLSINHELDIPAVVALSRIVGKEKIDIVHTHTAHTHTIALCALLFNRQTKLVVSRRVDFPVAENRFSKLKYTVRCNRYIAISEMVKQVLIEGGIPESKIALAHSGIDMAKFDDIPGERDYRNEFAISPDSTVIGNIAALAPHKAQRDLLDAARIVVDNDPSVHFLIIGDGDLKNELENRCIELNLTSHVTFTGFRTDIGELLRYMDIFVLSSRTEGLGTSVLDAMLSGVPVVATSAGGISEMVVHEETGLLSPPADSKNLAGNLLTLIHNRQLREKFGKAGKVRVREFDIEKTVDKTLIEYKKLMQS